MIKLVPILNRCKPKLIFFAALVVLLGISQSGWGQSQTFSTVGANSFTVPAGVTSIKVECWGGGGAGGQASTSSNGKGGGGGGAYASGIVAVNAGNNYTLTVGAGGKAGTEGTAAPDALSTSGGQSRFNTSVIIALGGTFGNNATNSGTGGAGGLASGSTGTIKYPGGTGGDGISNPNGRGGGGGGSSATAIGNGVSGSDAASGSSGTGGAGGIGGDGDGGKGGDNNNSGLNGTAPGGGGGGRGDIGPLSGDGARGQVIISWITVTAISTETCLGGSTGTITATATGGQTPYTYSLNGGTYQSSGIFSGLAAATYTINAKDNLGRIAFTSVTVNSPAASLDVQATAGSNSWLGHVYEGINFNTYIGHYTEPLETIDQSFGGDLNCFSVTSNSIARSIYTETFSVRYRMNSNKDGLYVVDLGSDDGSRLTVDGTLLYNDWNEHAFTSHPKVLMNLNGFSSLVYEFYENFVVNRVVFQNLTLVLANTLSTNINQPICLGNTGSAISGDVYGALPLGISISGTGYQWTYSTTSSGTRTAISGATGATYTPNTSAAPFNAPGTYYIYRNAVLSSVNNVSPSTYIATNESNAATITVNALPVATFSYAGSPYCKSASNPSPTFSGGGVAGTFSSTSGLLFVSNATGQVNLATSTAGTYTVTNTIVAAGGCGVVTATSSITITALPFATISYTGTPFCKSLVGAQSVTRTGTAGGTYTALPAGLSIDASTGSITPSSSTATTYTVTYTMASAGGCGAVTATTSITINPNLPVSILIAPSANSVCSGTSITFTATPTNGGTTPLYQWKVNGTNVGTNSAIYTYTPANNDAVTCALTSNASCATGSPATSNTVTMTVNPNLPVSVSIVASSNPIFSGTSVTFTASATNGGSTPTCQWKLNGSIVGSNSSTYANSSLVANDVVICIITSNASCTSGNPATSNSITMTVYPVIGNNVTDNINGAHGVLCTTAAENANAVLTAPAGTVFINVGFASYGMPNGTCPAFTLGDCHALTSQTTTEGYLLGNNTASIPATNGVFTDPCVGTVKKLYVLATYTEPICSGSIPGAIAGTLPTGGNGSFSYLWESSTTGSSSGFGSASGTNNLQNYTPGVLSQTTWYRRTVTSGGYNNISSVILIKVKPVIAGNTIGSAQTICSGSTPAALTGTVPTGGNGTYVYLWESSITNATTGFTSASGTNNGQNYSPGSLTQTRWFRRTVTSDGCIDISTAIQITATPLPVVTFSYTATPYCQNAVNPSPTFSGGGVAGTFTSAAGLVFVSTSTGQVNLSASTAGIYTVTNTIAASGGCGIVSATSQITITALPAATITYVGLPFCKSLGTAQPVTRTGTAGGAYSASPAGLSIDAATGGIAPSTSTAGLYTVTYTIASANGCGIVTATAPATITAVPTATISYTGSPFCTSASVGSVTLTGTGAYTGGTYSSTVGLTINSGTGAITPGSSTAGIYTVTYNTPATGGCSAVPATTSITITTLPVATFSYTATPYCQNAANPSATLSVGGVAGTFSSAAGLIFLNASTGQVNLAASTAGTYTVTNTIAASGGCAVVTATSQITITTLPAATISYVGSPFCKSLGTAQPVTRTGTASGAYSASPAGLSIDAATGAIIPSTSTAGPYTVTYTIASANGCGIVTATAPVTITAVATAAISYTGSPFCTSASVGSVTLTGTGAYTGGTYSTTAGLTINSVTGVITPGSSTAGTYTVTYNTPATGGCSAVPATTSITITTLPVATFSYTATPYCQNAVNPSATISVGGVAGIFSSTAGLIFLNASTGLVNLTASTAGTYTVTNTIAAAGGCAQVIATSGITITALPTATLSYTGSPWCSSAGIQNATFVGTSGGTYSSSTGLTINSSTGAITPGTSTAGTYTVTYTIAAANGCGIVTATTSVTITALPTATISYAGTPFCTSVSTAQSVTLSGTGAFAGGAYSSTAGLTINTGTGAITPGTSTAGTYTVTYNTPATGGCSAVPATTLVAISSLPSVSGTSTETCVGGSTGTITAVASGGLSPYTYSLNAGSYQASATFTGLSAATYTVNVKSNAGCIASTTVIVNPYATSNDSQDLTATDTWIGHVYDGINFLNYIGHVSESETFNELFSGNTTCFNVVSNLLTRSIYTETFSVKFKMNSTKRGLYVVDLGSDDGSRLTVDGVMVYNNWTDQSFSSRPSVLMNLNGTSKLVYDFYENGGLNQVVFQNLTLVLANTLSANTSQSICLGNSGSAIGGDVYGTLPTGITLSGTGYQWTYSTTLSGTRTTILGETGATFSPNTAVAPFNNSGTYFIYRNTVLRSTNNVAPNPFIATNESNVATITVNTLPVADFKYAGTLSTTISPTFSNGGVAGTFSSSEGLNFVNTATGEVNITASTPGTYLVYNKISASGGCGIVTATSSITITASLTVGFVWGGSLSIDWNEPINWLTGVVPDLNSDAIIPNASTTNYDPVLPSSPAASASVKTISLQSGGILNGGSKTTLTVAGSTSAWQNMGTFNAGTSTIRFTNTNTNTTMVGSTDFFNLTIADGASMTMETDYIMGIAGVLSLSSSGKLDATSNHNTVIYNGAGVTGDQTIINPNGTIPGYYNLILNGSGIKSLPPTAKLTVLGTLANNVGASGFVLQSDSTGTASLIHSTDSVSATVQRYISGKAEDWHFLASPVVAQLISGSWLPPGNYGDSTKTGKGTGYDLYLWNEPSKCWIYILDVDTTTTIRWSAVHPTPNFVPGRGYLYSLQALKPTKEFVGKLNNGVRSYPLSAECEDSKYKGFNLVGNPYPSAIDWKASGWKRDNLESIESGDYKGGNYMWIFNSDTLVNSYGVFNSKWPDNGGTNFATSYIPSMQGFFVKASSNGYLVMDNSVRVHDATGIWKSNEQEVGKVSVRVKSDAGSGSDEIQLRFGYSDNGNGAMKMFSRVLSSPNLYMAAKGNELSVMYLTNAKENPAVPVMFTPGVIGNYTIICNFDQSNFETVMLEDRQTHYIQNMKVAKTYSFKATKKDDANRFVLYFGPIDGSTGYELPARIYTDGTQLMVDLSLISKETNVTVYDIMGRKLMQQKLQGKILHNININLQTQMLVVYLQNPDGRLSRKIIWVRK